MNEEEYWRWYKPNIDMIREYWLSDTYTTAYDTKRFYLEMATIKKDNYLALFYLIQGGLSLTQIQNTLYSPYDQQENYFDKIKNIWKKHDNDYDKLVRVVKKKVPSFINNLYGIKIEQFTDDGKKIIDYQHLPSFIDKNNNMVFQDMSQNILKERFLVISLYEQMIFNIITKHKEGIIREDINKELKTMVCDISQDKIDGYILNLIERGKIKKDKKNIFKQTNVNYDFTLQLIKNKKIFTINKS